MAGTARIELAGVQVICTQAKPRIELAGVQVVCTRPKTRIELAGIQVIAQPLFLEEEYPLWPAVLDARWPERMNYPQGLMVDPTIRSPEVDGTPLYRGLYNPFLRTWSFLLRHLNSELKEQLEDFQEQVSVGCTPFYWTDIRTDETHLVQLAEPMIFDLDHDGNTFRTQVFLNEYAG